MKPTIWKVLVTGLILASTVSALFSVAKASDTIDILPSSGYLDSSGNYHIVGEVQNTGNKAVNFIKVTATFYDSYGLVIDSRFDMTTLYTVLTGRKSPFEISLLDQTESAAVDHYTLSVTYLETDDIPLKLAIPRNLNYTNTKGELHIIGDLKNLGDETLVNAKIVATYYGASSRVVAVASTGFDPEITGDITPNRTVQFEIVLDKSRAQYVETYVLAAESNQYAMISEFPTAFLLSCMLSFLTITMLICRRLKMPHVPARPRDSVRE